MRGKQRPRLPDATPALVCHIIFTCLYMASASGAGDLSDGQIAGVVIGSVGGALLLGLFAVFVCCCLRGSRLRQTGDLTWAKAVDLEAVAMAQTPHQPLSGPCEADIAASAQRGGSGAATDAGGGDDSGGGAACADNDASFAGNARTDISTVTGEGQSISAAGAGIDPAMFPSFPPSPCSSQHRASGRKMGFFRGRSVGSNVGNMAQFFVVHKGFLRNSNGNMKDKNLQVSRSARVEPSAEVEMAEPFQPAATNMGPPLSKSSMLLRWLNGADEGLPETAAAAQLAAAAANEGPAGRLGDQAGAGGRGGRGSGPRGGVGGGRGGAIGMSLDRLPLLSLAAQQTGIVWSKMPASVASSPAVSQAEGSSVHMLRGTWKRSDGHGDAVAAAGNNTAATALAAWHGGDDRYPASLGQASLGSFSKTGAARRSAAEAGMTSPGIVFDYVMRSNPSPSSSRTNTGGGGSSRAPTIGGGAVLPVSSSGGVMDRMSSGGGGFGGDNAFTMGVLPDEQMLAQALHRTSPTPGEDTPTSQSTSGRPWLHQTPPTKLTALQEEEGDADEVTPTPVPRPPLQPSTVQLLPAAAPRSLPASPGAGLSPPLTPGGGQSPLMTPGLGISPPPTPAGARSPGPPSPLPASQVSLAGVSEQVSVRSGWMHFGEDAEALMAGSTAGSFVQGAVGSDPATAAGSRLNPEPPLPLPDAFTNGPPYGSSAGTAGVASSVQAGRQVSPFLPAAGMAAAVAAGSSSTTDYVRVSASQVAAGYADKELPDVAEVSASHVASGPRSATATVVPGGIDRSASAGASVGAGGAAGAGVFMLPGRRPTDVAMAGAQPGGAPRASPWGSTTTSLRRSGAPPPLLPSQSGSSLRSQTSLVSPSLSIHYPDFPEGPSAEAPTAYWRSSMTPGPARSAADSAALAPGGDAARLPESAKEPAAVSVGSHAS